MFLHYNDQNALALAMILSLTVVNLVQLSSATNECFNFCSANGVCLKTQNGPKCICEPEWTGERCDVRQAFALTRQIRLPQTDRATLRNNLCLYAPAGYCQNGGSCYVDNGEFKCHCDFPFIGDDCGDLSECHNFCRNDGICSLSSGAPVCTCLPGWTGTLCQRISTTPTVPTTTPPPTTNLPCNGLPKTYCNSGMCIADPRARCLCPITHTGNQCQIPVQFTPSTSSSSSRLPTTTVTLPTISPPTTTSEPRVNCRQTICQHAGQCFNNGNSYFCLCRAPYTGKNCETIAG